VGYVLCVSELWRWRERALDRVGYVVCEGTLESVMGSVTSG
jgi:hypothetical protein